MEIKNLAAGLVTKDQINIPTTDVTDVRVSTIYTLVFTVVGGVSVIVIILSGIKFITSQGDPQAVAKARNSIIYAAVGLAISVAAFSIVTFVINRI